MLVSLLMTVSVLAQAADPSTPVEHPLPLVERKIAVFRSIASFKQSKGTVALTGKGELTSNGMELRGYVAATFRTSRGEVGIPIGEPMVQGAPSDTLPSPILPSKEQECARLAYAAAKSGSELLLLGFTPREIGVPPLPGPAPDPAPKPEARTQNLPVLPMHKVAYTSIEECWIIRGKRVSPPVPTPVAGR